MSRQSLSSIVLSLEMRSVTVGGRFAGDSMMVLASVAMSIRGPNIGKRLRLIRFGIQILAKIAAMSAQV